MEDTRFFAAKLGVGMKWVWRQDPWLSERLGLPALELLLPSQEALDSPLPEELQRAFVYSRIPVAQTHMVTKLFLQGFTLVDCAVSLERSFRPPSPPSVPGFTLRAAAAEDEKAVTALARSAYTLTRFHQDARIPKTMADDIQAFWAANYFAGKRGDGMRVAYADQTLAGFHLFLTPDSQHLVVDLIAVAPYAQGQGVGRALIDNAQQVYQCTTLRTGTQLANTTSLAFYQKLGFVHKSASYTLHRHPRP